jgi:hypothetical protein
MRLALLAGCATSRPAAVARPIDRAALAERVRAEFLFSWNA